MIDKNKSSLPHSSDENGWHLDINFQSDDPNVPSEKFHLPLEGPVVPPRSIDALRRRLGTDKGS